MCGIIKVLERTRWETGGSNSEDKLVRQIFKGIHQGLFLADCANADYFDCYVVAVLDGGAINLSGYRKWPLFY